MKVSVNVKMEESVRDNSREILQAMGMDMTTAVNMFLLTVIREKSIPFQISAVNHEALQQKFLNDINKAIEKSEQDIKDGKINDFYPAMHELRKKYEF